jgi:hypothetical protein
MSTAPGRHWPCTDPGGSLNSLEPGTHPSPGSQPAGLDGMVCLNVSKKLSKLYESHQLVMVVSRVEPLGLCLCQCHHAQLHVSLPLIELNPLLPQHLVEVEDELAVVGVSLYLLRYSYRVASALVHFSSRAVLTWARAFSEILAFSSLHASSPSLARSSSATIADSPAIAGPKDEGGSGLHKAYQDKSTMRQVNISTYCEGWPKPYLAEACVQ